jgi:hypothetical protein
LSEYSVNVFQFSINDFVLILVGNTIALKTQKSSSKKKYLDKNRIRKRKIREYVS